MSLPDLVPYEFAILIGWFAVGLLYMFGSLVWRRACLAMFLFTFVAPFLPSWGRLVFMAIVALIFLQGFAALLIGARAADAMVGNLAADLVRFAVRLLIAPLILALNWFRRRS